MIKVLIILLLIPFNASAFKDDPYEIFDVSKNFTQSNVIIWKFVADASATCQAESQKRGFRGWPHRVEACAFWNEKNSNPMTCTIFTNRYTNMHQLGHEIRHCFQGPYHD